MRRLARRIEHLELLSAVDPASLAEEKAAIAALSDDQLDWVYAPLDKAESRVSCPRLPDCYCACPDRSRLAQATFPDLVQEFYKRYQEVVIM